MPHDQRFITVASFPTSVGAELAAAVLREEGIDATLRDEMTTSVLPHLAAALGNVKVDVPADDAVRAQRLLRAIEQTETDDMTDDPRCPACESTYLEEVGGGLACRRCDHRFAHEDAAPPLHGQLGAGYRARPRMPAKQSVVFRLRRNRQGVGLLFGFLIIFPLFALGVQGAGIFWIALMVAAWAAGRWWAYFVCSDPSCRTRIRSNQRRCPGCNARVRGQIDRAGDHWVRRAALRRADDEPYEDEDDLLDDGEDEEEDELDNREDEDELDDEDEAIDRAR